VDDRSIVERQLGRAPRAFRRVVARCAYGLPAVTEQHPYDATGDPFPTTYYLTCPHLVAAVSRLEAEGAVERWTRQARENDVLASSLAQATALQRRLRRELAGDERGSDRGASLALGIAGSREPENLKCLHAHAAFALAHPEYELGRAILDDVEPIWPTDGCCSSP
jgi:uncharacterized protein